MSIADFNAKLQGFLRRALYGIMLTLNEWKTIYYDERESEREKEVKRER